MNVSVSFRYFEIRLYRRVFFAYFDAKVFLGLPVIACLDHEYTNATEIWYRYVFYKPVNVFCFKFCHGFISIMRWADGSHCT